MKIAGETMETDSFARDRSRPKEDAICAKTIALAKELLASALSAETPSERTESARLARLMNDPAGQAFTLALVDEVFRSANPATEARRWQRVLTELGLPRFLSPIERMLVAIGAAASPVVPRIVMPAVAGRMRADSARYVLPGESGPLHDYLTRRTSEGFRLNLNHLGEAVLGEEEAARRMESILGHLDDPAVSYISVKISAIFSQIDLVAWNETLDTIKDRLRRLYRAAQSRGKFVNLDMEEFRDLELTVTAFREILDEPEFHSLPAGIVLQACLPDSFAFQQSLTEWARERVATGRAPVKIRLVKGANLAMEKVEAELHGWNSAPYASKPETDANFRRMLEYGCRPENARAARLGVGSHNLFDVALALTLRKANDVAEFVEIEMLEGMANHQARAVRGTAGTVLLYAPAVKREDFLSAMAYLVRRLDENTTPGNFLRDLFAMRPGSAEWQRQRGMFTEGWRRRSVVSTASRRLVPAGNPATARDFRNEPDSDWTLPSTRAALNHALTDWQHTPSPPPAELDNALDRAWDAQRAWQARGISDRAAILEKAAALLVEERFDAIACLRANGKKAVPEADAEVSEAIDFARYYARTFSVPDGVIAESVGTVVVAPPWNFPYAIPCGGVTAALIAGNCVVLKPAPETVPIAWMLVRQLWAVGVPHDVLHFLPCEDGDIGRALITDPRVDCVILTGALETARMFQSWRPALPLLAETSGKNALVVTAQADRELAIKDLVKSAFGHAGQKCSAASLAILEGEVYDDPVFRRQLRDAAASLHAGPADDPRSVVTPLIREPGEALLRALTTLDDGEKWLLEPRRSPNDPCSWSPGIKLGVKPGSWFHRNECFGPVLGLMRAPSLDAAIAWQNATDYGLTAGIHSLDRDEITHWSERVEAGNLYINRPITGAIVQRQPFGGWKGSSIGPGAKAGGPNYLLNLCHLRDAPPAAASDVETSYRAAWTQHFSVEHDLSGLAAETNVFRYRPCPGVILRLDAPDSLAVERAKLASVITGTPLEISLRIEESDESFIARLPRLAAVASRFRTLDAPDDAVLRAAHETGLNWINAPLTSNGRIELRNWLQEQSVSCTRHRYGQIVDDRSR